MLVTGLPPLRVKLESGSIRTAQLPSCPAAQLPSCPAKDSTISQGTINGSVRNRPTTRTVAS